MYQMVSRLPRVLLGLAPFALALGLAPAALAGDAAAGKTLYEGSGTCWTCHGKSGTGDGPAAAALNPAPRDFSKGDYKFDADKDGTPGTDADLTLVIKNGAAAYGGNPTMTPWAHLGDDGIADLVAYVRSLKK